MARLLNLTGFRFKVSDPSYVGPMASKNEPVEDTFLDLAVYGVIGLILRARKWGR